MLTLKDNEVQSILNEEKPPWNKIKLFKFFNEGKCGPLTHVILHVIIIGFQY